MFFSGNQYTISVKRQERQDVAFCKNARRVKRKYLCEGTLPEFFFLADSTILDRTFFGAVRFVNDDSTSSELSSSG